MLVRILGDISGTRNGKPWPQRGAVVNLPQGEADSLCGCGMAERVPDDPPASPRPIEKATAARNRRKPETR